MTKMELVKTYEVDGERLTLTPNVVAVLIPGANQLPLPEVWKFITLCSARKLNPFTGDVYMTPHRDKITGEMKASIVVGKETFTKRAQRNPRFRGMEAGVTIINKKTGLIERRPGSMVGANTETLIGGWAKVYVDGWSLPMYEEVALSEYTTGRSLWATKPATMIRKVALVQALREAFPDDFAGMYDAAEMGVEPVETPDGVDMGNYTPATDIEPPTGSEGPLEGNPEGVVYEEADATEEVAQ